MQPEIPLRSLSDAERLDWLRLIRTETIGPVGFRRLLGRYRTAGRVLDALPELSRRTGRAALRAFPVAEAQAELRRADDCGARAIALCEPDYPPLLAAIEDAPPLIYVLGQASVPARPAIAVVGSRNASANGRRLAGQLARDLGAAGFVVVSGLARGIDTAAHQGALAAGTVAVLAGGVDVVYPEENRRLYAEILEGGAVIAEQPPGLQPQARHFPRRNRLISGLARGIVVVEASLHSGSLITARLALEQGREVFAVPGSPLDPRARGGNDLIRQGAQLIETAEDVLRGLSGWRQPGPAVANVDRGGGWPGSWPEDRKAAEAGARDTPPVPAADGFAADDAERIVEGLLSPEPVAVDEIVRGCHLSPAVVNTILLEWELAGRLERHPGNRVALIVTAGDVSA